MVDTSISWLACVKLENAICMQAEIKIKEDQISDLQEALKTQQAETDKAKEELTSALNTAERLKKF